MQANNSPVRRWCVMVALLATSACEKVVNITVPEGAKQLVVEGRLERVRGAVTGQQRIRLTTTDAYFSNTALPPARGASVRVVEEGGRVVSFGEVVNEPGVYATADLIAVLNRRYTLQIIYQNELYEATDVLRAVPPIDSLYEPVYRFYRALSDPSANDGSPFAVPLASVRGNISNLTTAANRPLGYFMATEVAEARAVVP